MRRFALATVRSRIHTRNVDTRSYAWLAALVAGLLLSCLATPAWAIDEATKSTALQYYLAAKGYYQHRQYLRAAKRFDLALDEVPLPVIALWAARSYQLAGDLDASQARYREAIRIEPNELWLGQKQQRAQRDATRELELVSKLAAAKQPKSPAKETAPSAKPGRNGQATGASHALEEADRAHAEDNHYGGLGQSVLGRSGIDVWHSNGIDAWKPSQQTGARLSARGLRFRIGHPRSGRGAQQSSGRVFGWICDWRVTRCGRAHSRLGDAVAYFETRVRNPIHP